MEVQKALECQGTTQTRLPKQPGQQTVELPSSYSYFEPDVVSHRRQPIASSSFYIDQRKRKVRGQERLY